MILDEGMTPVQIAEVEGVDESYVRHIYPLFFLSPTIKEMVLSGSQPYSLDLKTIKKGFPLGWKEQRDLLNTS